MKATRDDGYTDAIIDEMMAGFDDGREGMHPSVTDLIYCLTKGWYNTRPGGGAGHGKQTKVFFLIGLGTEQALMSKVGGNKPAGVYEGVFYHIDRVTGDVMDELKTTRKSLKGYEDKVPQNHLQQIQGYLKTQGLLKCKYTVVFLIPASVVTWELEFTQEEVDSNWDYLQGRRQVWLEYENSPTPPPAYTYNQAWECKDCPYKVLCDYHSNGQKIML